MKFMDTIDVTEIRIGERHRKAFARIDTLAASIDSVGLLQPVVLDTDNRLVAGHRRLKAWQESERGRNEPIPYVVSATVDDTLKMLRAESDENTCREALAPSEAVALARSLEAEFKRLTDAEAKQRMSEAGCKSKRGKVGKNNGSTKNTTVKKQDNSKRTRARLAEAVGMSQTTLDNAAKVVDAATSDPETYAPILAAMDNTGNVSAAGRDMREVDREATRAEAARQIAAAPTLAEALGAAKFSTIVIDPPWDYGDTFDGDWGRGTCGRADHVYESMTIAELTEFPIGNYAADDAHIYLWITNRSLPKGVGLLEAWGFRYITCVTWCKPSFGMGNYFRGSTEHLLFGVRGSLPLNRKDAGTWFTAPRGPDGHSSKPDEAYDLIESCSPGPYLDIFSRRQREGWTCWGGQL